MISEGRTGVDYILVAKIQGHEKAEGVVTSVIAPFHWRGSGSRTAAV